MCTQRRVQVARERFGEVGGEVAARELFAFDPEVARADRERCETAGERARIERAAAFEAPPRALLVGGERFQERRRAHAVGRAEGLANVGQEFQFERAVEFRCGEQTARRLRPFQPVTTGVTRDRKQRPPILDRARPKRRDRLALARRSGRAIVAGPACELRAHKRELCRRPLAEAG